MRPVQFFSSKAVTTSSTAGLPDINEGDHLIGAFIGRPKGPTLIAVGSLHGNEPAGAIALRRIAERLANMPDKLMGRVYFLAGNTRALALGKRFIDADLNRHWTRQNMSSGVSGVDGCCEDVELNELDSMLDSILVTAEDEVYVLDLHSTSADGKPFATVGDTLRNRRFAQRFPVTMLLGIEEQLNGTMLEYLNNAGAVTLGFEGGSHMSPRTADTHEALVWLALHNAGILNSEDIPDLERYRELLARGERGATVYEVRYRHAIRHDDDFVMTPGFNNFDPITSGQVVAMDRNGFVRANQTGLLLMPLYQKLGDDGFFIGRRVASVWLWISELLRTLGVQNMIHILPGVNRDPDDPETLVVNTSVARLFPLQIFHLLGFRRRRWSNRKLIVSRRKHDSVSPFIHSYR